VKVASSHGFIDGEYQDGEIRGRVFMCGASGYGKTFEMLRLVGQCRGGAVFYDSTGRHSIKGAVYVHQPAELKRELRRRLNSRFRVVYQPMNGELMEHFRAVCIIVEAFAGMTFAVDEIDEYCGPEWGQSRVPPELYKLVHFGRHAGTPGLERRGVALLYTARIPTSVARCLTSQASELRLFHEHEPEYVKYYSKVIHSRANAEKLFTLPKYSFYIWHNDGNEPALAGGVRRV
jgi:hypothetical protein